MALEDAAVLGELFGRSENPRDPADKRRLLAIYDRGLAAPAHRGDGRATVDDCRVKQPFQSAPSYSVTK
jgi:hypothetical protein